MRTARRVRHHLVIAGASVLVALMVSSQFGVDALRQRFSIITAYVGMGLMAVTLVIGPVNVLRGRANPVSTDLRRDIGIWAAVIGLAHFALGLGVHMGGRWREYFFPPPAWGARMPLRLDPFGISNHLGLIAGVVLLVLMAISSDAALRWMGRPRWKRWQRANYAGAVATVLHGALYQVAERRVFHMVVVFALVTLATMVAQGFGARAFIRSRAAESATATD